MMIVRRTLKLKKVKLLLTFSRPPPPPKKPASYKYKTKPGLTPPRTAPDGPRVCFDQ